MALVYRMLDSRSQGRGRRGGGQDDDDSLTAFKEFNLRESIGQQACNCLQGISVDRFTTNLSYAYVCAHGYMAIGLICGVLLH